MPEPTKVFYGGVISPLNTRSLSVLPHCLLCVDSAGNIARIIDNVDPHHVQQCLAMHGLVDAEFIALQDGEFIIPGFIDTHSVSS
jgi:guanine deaminase